MEKKNYTDETESLPLKGVRVLDFTWGLAGPYSVWILGMLGAECLKIEPPISLGDYADWRTTFLQPDQAHRGAPNAIPTIYTKRLAITLNFTKPRGLELAKRLIAISDVMVDSFRGGVLERHGLGWDEVRKINPRIVQVHQSAHGNMGREREGGGYAPIFAALGGASFITGYEDGPPAELRLPVDFISGTMGSFAILVALHHAQITGEGLFVDVANRETSSNFIGEAILDAAVNNRITQRMGNKDRVMAPHNVYRCCGEDKWVTIAVGTQEEWEALCKAVGHSEWLDDPRFADGYLRWKNQDVIDQYLEEWTVNHEPIEVMELLQGVGVAAAPSYSAVDVLADQHLHDRNYFVPMELHDGRPWMAAGLPWQFSRTPMSWGRTPKLGEHNEYVYQELLKLPADDIEELKAENVI